MKTFSKKFISLAQDFIALVAGCCLTFAFAPYNFALLAIICMSVLLIVWLKATPLRAFIRGWLFGLGLFGCGVSWVFISIHTYGHVPAFIAAALTLCFVSILALFPAITGSILNRYFPYINGTKLICAYPALWVIFEWIRGWIFTGFPWLSLGYSQLATPLKGYSPLFDVYGVSLAIVMTSGLIVHSYVRYKQEQYKLVYYSLGSVALLWIIGGLLSLIIWTYPTGKIVDITLVQGNIAQDIKWSNDEVQPTIDRYMALSKPHWQNQIIIWPEAAIPVPLDDIGEFIDATNTSLIKANSTLITGIPIRTLKQPNGYYNAVIAIGMSHGFYIKHRLVPFGEFIPMPKLVNRVMAKLDIPMTDFVAGNKINPKPLSIQGINIAPFICYEIAFPEQVLTHNASLGMLLTVSNDAWFGHSFAQAQHLQMAQMRSLELGRPGLFVANSGITAFIDEHGRIIKQAPPYEAIAISHPMRARKGKTPWQRFSLDPLLVILVGLLFISIKIHKK